jgi:hypothetical protein
MALESFAYASQAHHILAKLSLWLILPTHLLPGVIMFPYGALVCANFQKIPAEARDRSGGVGNVKIHLQPLAITLV